MIYLIGTGTGNIGLMTEEARNAILSSDVVIGSKRILEAVPEDFKGEKYEEVITSKIASLIDSFPEREISVLFSGDSGFYSGSKKLAEIYKDKAKVLPGIGSLSYMAAKIKRPYEDVKLLSAHGKDIDTTAYIASNREVFFLTGGSITPEFIINDAYNKGLRDVEVFVGENLSYENENIKSGSLSQLLDVKFSSLSVIWCVNNEYKEPSLTSFDMPDASFIKEDVPITKRDVRNASILELRLKKYGVFYDIGGGTGSLSVAVSKVSPFIKIYTVEKKDNALSVIERNFKKHKVINGHIIKGTAPDVLSDLPAPDYAFIGGTSGNLEGILSLLLNKNPNVRVVITALTLETIVDIKNAFANLGIENWSGKQAAISDIKKLGSYNALISQNPIFIFSFGGNDEL